MPAPTSPSRPHAWEWLQAALLAANLAWTTLGRGGFLPATMVLSSALTCALLVVHLLQRMQAREVSLPLHGAGWWLLPFLVYAAANVIWVTPVRWLGWQDWYGWFQLVATFWVALNGIRARGPRLLVLVTLGVIAFVGVLMACYQRFVRPDWIMVGPAQAEQFIGRSSGPFGAPNNFAGLLLLLLPACIALCFRPAASATQRVFFGWFGLVLAFGLVLTISRGAWIALALALVAWPFLLPRWGWRRRMGSGFGVLLLVVLAGATIYAVSPKSRARLQQMVRQAGELSRPILWRAAWQIFRAHPVVGGGAGSFNSRFEQYRPEREQKEPLWAHNDYLNTLSDYGALGGVLFFGACGAIAWRAARRDAIAEAKPSRSLRHAFGDPLVVQGFAVGLIAFALQLFVEFHLKIPALALTVATIAGLLAGRREGEDAAASRGSRTACGIGALAVTCAALGWIVPMFRAEGNREAARRELNRLAIDASPAEKRVAAAHALARFQEATDIDAGNAQAWADCAYAVAILSHVDPSREKDLGRSAEVFARKALGQTGAVAEFWLRLGVALDMQGRWVEAGDAFTEALRLAPASSQAWFYEAYHLSLNPVTRLLARAAVATCLRLDPASREGDTLRRNLAAGR